MALPKPTLPPPALPPTKYIAIPRVTNNNNNNKPSSLSISAVTESLRWEAVKTRNPSLNPNDSFFVYAVRSTRIYCRPNCPARLARRANVEFYDSASAAAAAGYRACKRCKPDSNYGSDHSSSGAGAGDQTAEQKVAKACETITCAVLSCDYHNCRRPSLRQLAAEAHLTPFHFHRVFKKVVGVTPGQYARDVAMRKRAGLVSIAADEVMVQETSSSLSSPSYDQNVTDDCSTFDDLVDWDWDAELALSDLLTDSQT